MFSHIAQMGKRERPTIRIPERSALDLVRVHVVPPPSLQGQMQGFRARGGGGGEVILKGHAPPAFALFKSQNTA